MNLVEMNYKIMHPEEHMEVEKVQQEHVDLFRSILPTSTFVSSLYNNVDDASAFYAQVPELKKLLPPKMATDIFYASKLGYIFEGVPSKMVYVISELFRLGDKDHVNLTLEMGVQLLANYAAFTYGKDKFTIKDVIENIIGTKVSLLTPDTRKVQAVDSYEVWVENANRVVLLPNDIAKPLSKDDVKKIEYDSERGLTLSDIPLRTMNNRVGCTLSDFDLRTCF